MSASFHDGTHDQSPVQQGFQSPLWGLDECFTNWRVDGCIWVRPPFQSPLWGLDECFRRGRPGLAGTARASFSPLYGDWMSASSSTSNPPRGSFGTRVSVPFMGIG